MNLKKIFLTYFICLAIKMSYAQTLVWNGSTSNNFFTEQNWTDSATNAAPANGTLDPGVAINRTLIINSFNNTINANGVIALGIGSLSITDANLSAFGFSGGEVNLNQRAYVDLITTTPLQNNSVIKLNSSIAWVRTTNLKGELVLSNLISNFLVNNQVANYPNNLRLDNYYFNGTTIRIKDHANTRPFRLFENNNLSGNSFDFSLDVIHSENFINSNLNNTASFVLRKGYMVTLAANADGTGKSKNYIASEQDLIVNELPIYLKNKVKFIRVLPWNWVNKKGVSLVTNELNSNWFYRWNNNMDSNINIEYVPMSWGAGGANNNNIPIYLSKYKSTHVLGFNEPDDCNAQSGQFNNLCQTDVAVNLYRNLMKTGMRLVSPNGREEAPFGWVKEFMVKANALDIRVDVIGVHWYDWGSNPASTPNATPQQIFNRFATYLQNVYNLYGLPIWITEFNANPNRSNATNLAFMQLALPYLETLDYVERYCWFQPSSGTANFFESDETTLNNVGNFYKNQVSNPSIVASTVNADNNLDKFINIVGYNPNNLVNNSDFELGNLTAWFGQNIQTLTGTEVYQGTTSGRILNGSGHIFHLVPVTPNTVYDLSFFTKWFASPTSPIAVQILNASNNALITSQLMTNSTSWNQVNLTFTVPSNVESVKVYVEKQNQPGWFIDNVVMQRNVALSQDTFLVPKQLNVFPNPSLNEFNISSNHVIKSLEIYTITGQKVLEKSNINAYNHKINLENNPKGVYLLVSKNEDETKHSQKLILR